MQGFEKIEITTYILEGMKENYSFTPRDLRINLEAD